MTEKNRIRQHSTDNSCLSADKIDDYLAGRLDANEMELVSKHISECEFCADAVEGYKNVRLKDTLLNTVEKLNKEIDDKTVKKEYRLQSFTKKIIAYSSLAASILIITGLFLLIKNLRIRNNLVTDKLSVEEEKKATHEAREITDEATTIISYDSLAEDNRGEKAALKEELLPVAGKSEYTSYDKHDRKDIMEPEAVDYILETEVDMEIDAAAEAEVKMQAEVAMKEGVAVEEEAGMKAEADREIEKVAIPEYKITDAPAAREAELSAPFMYDKGDGRKKARLAKKGYSQPQEILTVQMQSDEDLLYEETIYPITDELPVFGNNGLEAFKEYVQKNLQYPGSAIKSGIEGKVFVKFDVDTVGRVVGSEIIKSIDSLLSKEALRVIDSSPLWIPGKQDGKPVKVTYIMPVIFRID